MAEDPEKNARKTISKGNLEESLAKWKEKI